MEERPAETNLSAASDFKELPRKLVAIMVLDVVGFTKLISGNKAQAVDAFLVLREEINRLIQAYGGRIFKTTGDGLLAEFNQLNSIIQCAISIQKEILARNTTRSGVEHIEVRIGISAGDVLVDGDDLLGDTINIAARLQSVASPGCIAVAHGAFESTFPSLALSYRTLGHLVLHNVPHSVFAHEILLGNEADAATATEAVLGSARTLPFIVGESIAAIRQKNTVKRLMVNEAELFLHEIPRGRFFYTFRIDLLQKADRNREEYYGVARKLHGSSEIEVHKNLDGELFFIAYILPKDAEALPGANGGNETRIPFKFVADQRFHVPAAIPIHRAVSADWSGGSYMLVLE